MFASHDELLAAYEDGERPELRFALHALSRGCEMADQLGLDPMEIRRAMRNPERFYLSEKYGRVNLIRGRVCLALDIGADGLPVVVTVLWSRIRDWKAAYAVTETEGRERRFGYV